MKYLLATLLLTLSVAFNIYSQHSRVSEQLKSLIESERSFAKLSVEKGVQASFLTWFADDGINFQPQPTNLKESWGSRPVPKDPPPVVLNWAPIYGDISISGDLGYSTGPFIIEDHSPQRRPTQHGLFFSIWKKQADDSWKVVVDLGVQLDGQFASLDAEYQPASAASPRNLLPHGDARAKMIEAEKSFWLASKTVSAEKAWKDRLSSDARIYRPKETPVIGAEALQSWIKQQTGRITGQTLKSDLAASGDLGYTIGSYELHDQNIAGYYVRVWKLDRNARWRIAFDVTNIVPKG